MIKRIALLVTVLILALGTPVMAAEPGKGVIEGALVNKTKGGGGVTDQTVTLKTYKNDTETGSATAKTLADGKFTFTGLATDAGNSYQVTLTYQGAEYTGDKVAFGKDETKKTVEVTVWDSTSKDDAIRLQAGHTVITPQEGTLLVQEYFVFVNNSDRTYIGPKDPSNAELVPTLRFSLPKGASNLQYEGLMQCCVVNIENGIADSMAVMPGQKEVMLEYQVPYKSTGYQFTQKVNHPLDTYNFLVQGESVSVTASKLTKEQPVNFQGKLFNYFTGEDIAKGDLLVVDLAGLPKSSSVGLVIAWMGGALAVLAGGFFVAYQRRTRKAEPVAVASAGPPEASSRKRQRLLSDIARLDDEFEAGLISQEVYKKQRAEKKAQLVELMRRSQGVTGKG
ncbi:MAG: hypothetical protein HY667_00985 [Chloroflexi bacterium]|nr:hypothetical protein [Chloroflexota bacterium]